MDHTWHDTPLTRRIFFREWCEAMRHQYAVLFAAGLIQLRA